MSEEFPDEFMEESQVPLDVLESPQELKLDVMDDSQEVQLNDLENAEYDEAENIHLNSMNESEEALDRTDSRLEDLPCSPAPPAAIKLFIARIPKDYQEEDVKKLFEEFGPVTDVFIIKDKNTNIPKNCAFVKMSSICQADAAIRKMNNQHVVEPALGAVQIRYATGEPERLGFTQMVGEPGVDSAKLFVGSLPKTFSEEELKDLFKDYGSAVETFLLKDMNSGGTKGCGFVRMKYKEQALYAIKELDGKKVLKDSARPIEVRFAQNKNALIQDPQQMFRNKRPPPPFDPTFGHNFPPNFNQFHMGNNLPNSYNNNYNKQRKRRNGDNMGYMSYNNGNPRHAGAWREFISPDGRFYYYNVESGSTQWEVPKDFLKLNSHNNQSNNNSHHHNNGGFQGGVGSFNNSGHSNSGGLNPPDDSSLFVFHIPNQWTNSDLFRTFSQFGRVVKAKIVFDKVTNRSKGYAFVSYDNPDSATQAVANMNGFNIMGKKLKVVYKTSRQTPY